MKKFLIIVIMVCVLLSGCTDNTQLLDNSENKVSIGNGMMFRVIDKEAGVVCWMSSTLDSRAGIFCLPLSETKLDQ